MSDLCSKYEQDRTKTAVAIVHERNAGQTHRQTYIRVHSSDFMSVQCHALHWIDNKSTTIHNKWKQLEFELYAGRRVFTL